MVKMIFFVLLTVNLALFGMIKGLWGPKATESHEPKRLLNQMNAEQLRLVSTQSGDNPPVLASAIEKTEVTPPVENTPATEQPVVPPVVVQTATPAAVAPAPVPDPVVTAPVAIPAETPPQAAQVAAPPPAVVNTPPAKPAVNKAPETRTASAAPSADAPKTNNLVCVEAGYFVLTDARKFETQINRIPIGMKEVRRSVEEVVSYMVRIPANNGQIGANRRAVELQKAGIHDFYIVPGTYSIDNLRWSVSLGVFKTENAAKSYMRDLTAKGIKQMVITPRKATSSKIAYQFKNVTPAQRNQIDKVMNNFSGQDLHHC